MTDPITFERDGVKRTLWVIPGPDMRPATPDDLRAAGWVHLDTCKAADEMAWAELSRERAARETAEKQLALAIEALREADWFGDPAFDNAASAIRGLAADWERQRDERGKADAEVNKLAARLRDAEARAEKAEADRDMWHSRATEEEACAKEWERVAIASLADLNAAQDMMRRRYPKPGETDEELLHSMTRMRDKHRDRAQKLEARVAELERVVEEVREWCQDTLDVPSFTDQARGHDVACETVLSFLPPASPTSGVAAPPPTGSPPAGNAGATQVWDDNELAKLMWNAVPGRGYWAALPEHVRAGWATSAGALRRHLLSEPEPGQPIGECGCPSCGARLKLEHGDEPGWIAATADAGNAGESGGGRCVVALTPKQRAALSAASTAAFDFARSEGPGCDAQKVADIVNRGFAAILRAAEGGG